MTKFMNFSFQISIGSISYIIFSLLFITRTNTTYKEKKIS